MVLLGLGVPNLKNIHKHMFWGVLGGFGACAAPPPAHSASPQLQPSPNQNYQKTICVCVFLRFGPPKQKKTYVYMCFRDLEHKNTHKHMNLLVFGAPNLQNIHKHIFFGVFCFLGLWCMR